ncbi:MAG: hypothetical protein B7Z51_06690, partial [Methyloversatilis sp. 12-65-5]
MTDEKSTVDRIIDVSIDVERTLDRLKETFRDRKYREAVELLTEEQQGEVLAAMTALSELLAARNAEYEALMENWSAYDAERENPKLLYLTREQLMRHEAAGVSSERFPAKLDLLGQRLKLEYRHEPGAADDGVTLTVPLTLLNQIPAAR